MYSTHPPHDQSVQRTLPHPEPRPNPPQETTSNLPHPPLLPEVSHSTIPSQNSSIHNTNNSSGTLNRVTGDQRFDARSVSTLLNCEGTTIQLVVMSGEAAGEAAGEARATGQVLRDGDGGASSRAEIQRLQARTEELQSDIEWMETRAEDLLLEIERLKDDVHTLSGRLRRLHPPAHEWAEGTSFALQSKLDDQSPQPIHSLNTGATTSSSPIGVGGSRVSAPPLTSKASTSSTPGHEFPGAYPRDNSTTPGIATSAVGTAKDTAYQIYESAKQYIPAQEDIQQTLENASTTAKQYLPASVGAYLPDGKQAISLPSQEVYGNMGTSSDGVGALPGTLSEVSVAKLPEERRLEGLDNAKSFAGSYAREQAWSQTSSGGVGDLPGPKSETGVAVLPDERTARGMSGGVGDLPGSKAETDVTRLPEEKAVDGGFKALPGKPVVTTTNQHSTASPVNHHSAGPNEQADSNASNVALPPTPGPGGYSTNNAVLPPAIPSTGNEFGRASAGGVVNSGFGTLAQNAVTTTNAHDAATLDAAKAAGVEPKETHGPAVPPKASGVPRHVADDKPIARKDISEVATTGHGSHHGRTASQTESRRKSHDLAASHLDTRAASDHPKDRSGSMSSSSSKPSFMDKVKGEVKVISGKLGKNEEKVEEGRRMMGKE